MAAEGEGALGAAKRKRVVDDDDDGSDASGDEAARAKKPAIESEPAAAAAGAGDAARASGDAGAAVAAPTNGDVANKDGDGSGAGAGAADAAAAPAASAAATVDASAAKASSAPAGKGDPVPTKKRKEAKESRFIETMADHSGSDDSSDDDSSDDDDDSDSSDDSDSDSDSDSDDSDDSRPKKPRRLRKKSKKTVSAEELRDLLQDEEEAGTIDLRKELSAPAPLFEGDEHADDPEKRVVHATNESDLKTNLFGPDADDDGEGGPSGETKRAADDYDLPSDDDEDEEDESDDEEADQDVALVKQADDALAIFGDDSGTALAAGLDASPAKRKRQRAAKLQKFEPAALRENFMGDRDDALRESDVPERLNVFLASRAKRYTSSRTPADALLETAQDHDDEAEGIAGGLDDSVKQPGGVVQAALDAHEGGIQALVKVVLLAILDGKDDYDVGSRVREELSEAVAAGASMSGVDSDQAEAELTDFSERFVIQVRQLDETYFLGAQRALESAWIVEQHSIKDDDAYYDAGMSDDDKARLANVVQTILRLVIDETLEIPFIWMYRRDDIWFPELQLRHLWEVLDLDERWTALATKKRRAAEKARLLPSTDLERVRDALIFAETEPEVEDAVALVSIIIASSGLDEAVAASGGTGRATARKAAGEEEDDDFDDAFAGLDDMYDMDGDDPFGFSGDAGADEADGGADGAKRKGRGERRRDHYRRCVDAGLAPLRAILGITSTEFVDNIIAGEDSADHIEGPKPPADPETVAADYVSPDFPTPAAALAGARFMAATEIAREASFVRKVRRRIRDICVVNTRPTAAGATEIDSEHDYFGLHVLKDKLLDDFFAFRTEPKRPPPPADEIAAMTWAEFYGEDDSFPALKEDVQSGIGGDPLGLNNGVGTRIRERQKEDRGWAKPGGLEAGAAREPARLGGPGQWLLLQKAAKRGLIHIETVVDEERLARRFRDSFLSIEGVANNAASAPLNAWDEQRKLAVDFATVKLAGPRQLAALKEELVEVGRETVVSEWAATLRRRALVAPWRRQHPHDSAEVQPVGGQPRVLSIRTSVDRRQSPNVAVTVDESGDVKKVAILPGQSGPRAPRAPGMPRALSDDEKALIELCESIRPHVIVVNVGAGHLSERMFNSAVRAAEEWAEVPIENRGFDHASTGAPIVVYGDDDVPRVYSASRRGAEEFATETQAVRFAIGQARYLQNPLAELAGMWPLRGDGKGGPEMGLASYGDDLLALGLHDLQDLVPTRMKLKAAERVMVEVANLVGVNLSAALARPHMLPLLQFVAGFGPRKALQLKEAAGTRTLVRREQLTMTAAEVAAMADRRERRRQFAGGIGGVVYRNCAGFIRVLPPKRRDGLLLERTRIHPECYPAAVKMAALALDEEVTDDPQEQNELVKACAKRFEEAAAEAAATYSLPKDKLGEINVTEFATSLAAGDTGTGDAHQLFTLTLIRDELRQPLRDPRRPYQPMNKFALLRLLHGESRLTLREGLILVGTVFHVVDDEVMDDMGQVKKKQSVKVRFDSGMIGWLPGQNLADQDTRNFNLLQYFPKDRPLRVRALKIEVDRKTLVCSCATSALTAPVPRPPLDAFADESQIKEEVIEEDEDVSKGYRTRPIEHPSFRNENREQVEAFLDTQERFSFVFRPHREGPNQLMLTWKWKEGRYAHIPVHESDKPDNDPLALGKDLVVYDEHYSELDEIISRVLERMASNVREFERHKKYREISRAECDAVVTNDKRRNPGSVPYYFYPYAKQSIMYEVMFHLKGRTRHEIIKVLPSGFRYRSIVFATMRQFVEYFKLNFAKMPRPRAPPPPQQPPPMPQHQGGGGWQGAHGGGFGAPPPPQYGGGFGGGFAPPPHAPPAAAAAGFHPQGGWGGAGGAPAGGMPPGQPPFGGGYNAAYGAPPQPQQQAAPPAPDGAARRSRWG